MSLTCCRYLALLYAIGLAIGEAVLNSIQDQWQYAPMWIIDYLIVAYLLIGFWVTRRGRHVPILMSAYALSTGVMDMVFFLGLDPEAPEAARLQGLLLGLVGLVFAISVLGLAGTTIVWQCGCDHRPRLGSRFAARQRGYSDIPGLRPPGRHGYFDSVTVFAARERTCFSRATGPVRQGSGECRHSC